MNISEATLKVTSNGLNIEIDDKRVIEELISNLNLPYGSYLSKDGDICITEDISYHGSPTYETTVICDAGSKKAIKYALLKKLLALY